MDWVKLALLVNGFVIVAALYWMLFVRDCVVGLWRLLTSSSRRGRGWLSLIGSYGVLCVVRATHGGLQLEESLLTIVVVVAVVILGGVEYHRPR